MDKLRFDRFFGACRGAVLCDRELLVKSLFRDACLSDHLLDRGSRFTAFQSSSELLLFVATICRVYWARKPRPVSKEQVRCQLMVSRAQNPGITHTSDQKINTILTCNP